MRQLVVNADDFGFTRDTNDGIIAAHREGILTATTLMANAAAFDHAVELAHSHPTLDVGCHLVLVGGPGQPGSVGDLLVALTRGQVDPYGVLRGQIEKIVAAGIRPRHLDTHKHTHLWPPVLKAVARLSQEFQIPWVRRPFDFPLSIRPVPWTRRLMSATLGGLRPWFHRVLSQHGCRTTDHFAGFEITGAFVADDLVKLVAALPEGSTEFMCHPGYLRDDLRQARTRLKESREQELQALIHPSVREALTRHGVRLVGYRDL